MSGSGLHPTSMMRVIRIAGLGVRKTYKKKHVGCAIIHRPIIRRIGVGLRRKPTVHRAGAWQLASTKRGTGRKHRVGRPIVRRPRVIKIRLI